MNLGLEKIYGIGISVFRNKINLYLSCNIQILSFSAATGLNGHKTVISPKKSFKLLIAKIFTTYSNVAVVQCDNDSFGNDDVYVPTTERPPG